MTFFDRRRMFDGGDLVTVPALQQALAAAYRELDEYRDRHQDMKMDVARGFIGRFARVRNLLRDGHHAEALSELEHALDDSGIYWRLLA